VKAKKRRRRKWCKRSYRERSSFDWMVFERRRSSDDYDGRASIGSTEGVSEHIDVCGFGRATT